MPPRGRKRTRPDRIPPVSGCCENLLSGVFVIEPKNHIILGSRGSALALAQAVMVRSMFRDRFPEMRVDISIIRTEGDVDRTSPLSSFGGRGAFVRTIEDALLRGDIDVAVHSLKDLPSTLPDGLTLGAVPFREDPRDAIVSCYGVSFRALPEGSVIATGSDRRRIQLVALRPDLVFHGIRGNVESRIRKIGTNGITAVALAYAGLRRLGVESRTADVFSTDEVLPAPCQGAIGLECRAGDAPVLTMLAAVENPAVRACVDTEREFIAALGLGCHAPVAAFAEMRGEDIRFDGLAASPDGAILRRTITVPEGRARAEARKMADEIRNALQGAGTENG